MYGHRESGKNDSGETPTGGNDGRTCDRRERRQTVQTTERRGSYAARGG